MARSHGKIHAEIWRDEDFRALTAEAQRLFFLLLSQPKLTLCGTLDMAVTKWAKLATNTTVETIETALFELEDAGLVVTDDGELAIRTFTKHDIAAGRFNSKLAKGLWSAWDRLDSDLLRKLVVAEVPDDLWEKLEEHAPDSAKVARDLLRNEPIEPLNGTVGSNRTIGERESAGQSIDNRWIEPYDGTPCRLSPVAGLQSPASVSHSTQEQLYARGGAT